MNPYERHTMNNLMINAKPRTAIRITREFMLANDPTLTTLEENDPIFNNYLVILEKADEYTIAPIDEFFELFEFSRDEVLDPNTEFVPYHEV